MKSASRLMSNVRRSRVREVSIYESPLTTSRGDPSLLLPSDVAMAGTRTADPRTNRLSLIKSEPTGS